MPVVKSYQRQIDLERAPTPQRQHYAVPQLETPPPESAPSPEAMGAGFSRTVSNIGQELYAREIQRQDEVRVTDGLRQVGELRTQILDPRTGALSVKGKDAFGISEKAGEAFDKQVGQIRTGLNPRQQFLFDPRVSQQRQAIMDRLNGHAAEQMQAVDVDATNGTVENEINAANADAYNPQRTAEAVGVITDTLEGHYKRNGRNPQDAIVKAAVAAKVSQVHEGNIDRYLSDGNDIQAKVYYEHAQDQIVGSRRGGIEKALETGSTAGDAFRAATDIWQQHGPKTDTDTVSLDVLAKAAREQFPNDSKRANATIHELEQRKQEFDSGSKARLDKAESDVWQMALAGAPLPDIKRTPQYRALDGKSQTVIDEHVADRLYGLDQRAKSAADYLRTQREHAVDEAFQAESRAHTRQQWSKQDAETAAFAKYGEVLSDPAALSRMSESEIIKLLPIVGKTNMNDLLSKRKELNSPDKVQKATIDNDLFNELADEAELHPFKDKKTEAEKGSLGALRKSVLDIIASEQQGGKTVDRDRKEEIMREEIKKHVYLNVWGSDPQVIAGSVTADQRAKAYVPFAEIPADIVQAYTGWMMTAGLLKDGESVPQDRMQRAYALRQMNASREEIYRALQGKK
jgi:hypothetical protein